MIFAPFHCRHIPELFCDFIKKNKDGQLNQVCYVFIKRRHFYDILINTGVTISTAESCTGGNLASLFTYFSGSSTFYKGGVIAYANEVKTNLLGVDARLLVEDGAVSESVVVEMAKGVQRLLKSDCSIATSGIAGPLGGTVDKPVELFGSLLFIKRKLLHISNREMMVGRLI